MKPVLTILLMAVSCSAQSTIMVKPLFSFVINMGNNSTNVGWVTNWTSPILAKGVYTFCCKTHRDFDGAESPCALASFTLQSNRTIKASWDFPAPSYVPMTNVVTIGGTFESSSNLKDWAPAFSFSGLTLTNPTTSPMFYRVNATITRK